MGQTERKHINERGKRRTIIFAVWDGVLIAVILLVTTIWVSNSALGHGKRLQRREDV